MAYPTTVHKIGGDGGQKFSLTGEWNGATLKQLHVWVGGSQVRGVQVFLTDGRDVLFGERSGPSQEYTFQPGECFTSLSLWGNGERTRLGGHTIQDKSFRRVLCQNDQRGLEDRIPHGCWLWNLLRGCWKLWP
ncbi:hypothetical protein KUCAC02_024796 [Chaenocephalus aceratus]|nr:hypothetical protein KUCAC02_024796 [Chaenocephalus aceratus]